MSRCSAFVRPRVNGEVSIHDFVRNAPNAVERAARELYLEETDWRNPPLQWHRLSRRGKSQYKTLAVVLGKVQKNKTPSDSR